MRPFLKLSVMTGILTATFLVGCLSGSTGSSGTKMTLSAANPETANPTVEGPIKGGLGIFISATSFPLSQVGYTSSEYFLSGNATGYEPVGTLATDGKWNVKAASHADYKTRIVAYRPINAAKFNGTVVMEWLNVSGGLDSAPDWINAHNELIRQGYAWVGVSAQAAGIEGGGSFSVVNLPLKKIDPKRYKSLNHPGDTFSYDIFSQAAQAVRHPQGIDPLGGLGIKKLIAAGESQSAYRMTTYVNAIAPLSRVFDGFFIHSRPHGSAALADSPQASTPIPSVDMAVNVRNDSVPVMMLQTESDLFLLGSYMDRQDDSATFRLWEVAGTAHADTYTVNGAFDKGGDPKYAEVVSTSAPVPGLIDCGIPINSGPQHFVVSAAFSALQQWLTSGTPPPSAPRLTVSGNPAAYVLDSHGIVLGGIRTPYVDTPIATLSGSGQGGGVDGLGQGGNTFCFLFGTTTMFDNATLLNLYPDHATYVADVNTTTDSAVARGHLLPTDGQLIKDAAQASTIGK
jgi:hypothetical protein